jgi:hypothetical protein
MNTSRTGEVTGNRRGIRLKRMRKFYETLPAGKQKLIADNQKLLTYSSGMAGPLPKDQKEEDDTDTQRTLKQKRSNNKTSNNNIKCNKFGLLGHARSNSLKCMYNKKKMEEEKKQANEAREKGMYHMRHVCVYVHKFFSSTDIDVHPTQNRILLAESGSDSDNADD